MRQNLTNNLSIMLNRPGHNQALAATIPSSSLHRYILLLERVRNERRPDNVRERAQDLGNQGIEIVRRMLILLTRVAQRIVHIHAAEAPVVAEYVKEHLTHLLDELVSLMGQCRHRLDLGGFRVRGFTASLGHIGLLWLCNLVGYS